MLSEDTLGERIDQAHHQRERDHVILSEAKDLRAAYRDRPPSAWMLTFLLGAREASKAT